MPTFCPPSNLSRLIGTIREKRTRALPWLSGNNVSTGSFELLELVPERKLHAASRPRVASCQHAVVLTEIRQIREPLQLSDVELRRVREIEHVPTKSQPVIRHAD